MSKNSSTKDEKFLLKLFELAKKLGDATGEVDRYAINETMGQKHIDGLIRNLAKSNFVKKGDGNCVYLTSNGLELIKMLKGDV